MKLTQKVHAKGPTTTNFLRDIKISADIKVDGLTRAEADHLRKCLADEMMNAIIRLPYCEFRLCEIKVSR
jgi:hypothetical protein